MLYCKRMEKQSFKILKAKVLLYERVIFSKMLYLFLKDVPTLIEAQALSIYLKVFMWLSLFVCHALGILLKRVEQLKIYENTGTK